MKSKGTILIDMDNILVDTLPEWLKFIQKDTGIIGNLSDITDWDFFKCPKYQTCTYDQIYTALKTPNWFLDLPPMPGGPEVIDSLVKEGYNVHILSAPFTPLSCQEKQEWILRNVPSIPLKNVILGSHKDMVCGDLLIDDKPQTLIDYKIRWPKAHLATIEYEYNKYLSTYGITVVPYGENAWVNLYHKIHEIKLV